MVIRIQRLHWTCQLGFPLVMYWWPKIVPGEFAQVLACRSTFMFQLLIISPRYGIRIDPMQWLIVLNGGSSEFSTANPSVFMLLCNNYYYFSKSTNQLIVHLLFRYQCSYLVHTMDRKVTSEGIFH